MDSRVKGETMEFAEILKSLIPGATRATIEVGGATITIEPKAEAAPVEIPNPANLGASPEAVGAALSSMVEGVSMEDIQVPAKPKKARKPKIHRTAIQMAIQRGALLDAVKKMGKNGATSRELLGCGMPRETIYADLKVLEKEGHIIRSGKVYYPS